MWLRSDILAKMVGSAPTTGAIGACLLFAFVAVVGVHVSRATGLEGAQLEAGGSAPPTCPGFSVVEGTGTAVDPFQSSKQADASGCCSFCSTLGARCVAWTWHSTTGICFVSNFSTPHSSADATGATRTAPPTPVNPPLGYQPNIIFVRGCRVPSAACERAPALAAELRLLASLLCALQGLGGAGCLRMDMPADATIADACRC